MKETFDFLNNILKDNDIVIVACSGGPDSMFLLDVLKKFNVKIIVAHVNHSLRKESDSEKVFVEEYCNNNNLVFEYMKIEKYKNNKFTEDEARRIRYNFFNKLLKKYKAKYIFTAHHGDDLIETIMMRITRGSNLKGYVGIPKISGKYVRPLIYLTKDEILSYLKKNKIEYVIDNSNKDEKYTRNRYRKRMLPFLKKEDDNVHKKYLQYSEELESAYNYIDRLILKKYNKIVKNNIINIDLFNKEDEYVQNKIIEKVIENIQKDYIFNVSKNSLNSILELTNGNNREIDLKDGFIARKSYNKLIIEKKFKETKYYYELEDSLNILNKYHFEILKKTNDNSNNVIRLDSNEIKLPLIIRNKIDGDKIEVKNLGTKKISDIFIDSKVDKNKRLDYPIVTDSNNIIIWIPGLKKSKFDKEKNENCDIIVKYTEENNE